MGIRVFHGDTETGAEMAASAFIQGADAGVEQGFAREQIDQNWAKIDAMESELAMAQEMHLAKLALIDEERRIGAADRQATQIATDDSMPIGDRQAAVSQIDDMSPSARMALEQSLDQDEREERLTFSIEDTLDALERDLATNEVYGDVGGEAAADIQNLRQQLEAGADPYDVLLDAQRIKADLAAVRDGMGRQQLDLQRQAQIAEMYQGFQADPANWGGSEMVDWLYRQSFGASGAELQALSLAMAGLTGQTPMSIVMQNPAATDAARAALAAQSNAGAGAQTGPNGPAPPAPGSPEPPPMQEPQTVDQQLHTAVERRKQRAAEFINSVQLTSWMDSGSRSRRTAIKGYEGAGGKKRLKDDLGPLVPLVREQAQRQLLDRQSYLQQRTREVFGENTRRKMRFYTDLTKDEKHKLWMDLRSQVQDAVRMEATGAGGAVNTEQMIADLLMQTYAIDYAEGGGKQVVQGVVETIDDTDDEFRKRLSTLPDASQTDETLELLLKQLK